MKKKLPPKTIRPLKYSAGYTLHLYCDRDRLSWEHNNFDEFYGQTFKECAKEAKKKGWIIRRDRTATCDYCNKGK